MSRANLRDVTDPGLSGGNSVTTVLPKAKVFDLYVKAFAEGIRLRTKQSGMTSDDPELPRVQAQHRAAKERAAALKLLADKSGWSDDMTKYCVGRLTYLHNVGSRDPVKLGRMVTKAEENLRKVYLTTPSVWSQKVENLAAETDTNPDQQASHVLGQTLQSGVQLRSQGSYINPAMNQDLSTLANSMPVRFNLLPAGLPRDAADLANIGLVTGVGAMAQMALSMALRGHNFLTPSTPAHDVHYAHHYYAKKP